MRELINKVKNFGEFLNENVLINDVNLLISKYYENNLGVDLYDENNVDFYNDIVKVINKTNVFLNEKKDKVLYRIINADTVDYNKLGLHYVSNLKDINTNFLFNIGLGFHDSWDNYKIIKIKVPYSDIDINNTYFHNINNPTEFEINLKTDKNIKILDTFKYK